MADKIADFMFQKSGVSNLGKFMDVASFRHKLISGNIANASTPGYQSKDINFFEEFRRVTESSDELSGTMTHENHIPLGNHASKAPEVNEAKVTDGEMNSVDADKEISGLAQNELIYTVGARLLKDKFDSLRKAIETP
ncbi:MAG TPA: flagellar basal body rod protein FlgB [candidate division Zixibacteria bacterium]|nr:flagellar basal body rod protein FlgB [candidate division Zixibacteria bacterium]